MEPEHKDSCQPSAQNFRCPHCNLSEIGLHPSIVCEVVRRYYNPIVLESHLQSIYVVIVPSTATYRCFGAGKETCGVPSEVSLGPLFFGVSRITAPLAVCMCHKVIA